MAIETEDEAVEILTSIEAVHTEGANWQTAPKQANPLICHLLNDSDDIWIISRSLAQNIGDWLCS